MRTSYRQRIALVTSALFIFILFRSVVFASSVFAQEGNDGATAELVQPAQSSEVTPQPTTTPEPSPLPSPSPSPASTETVIPVPDTVNVLTSAPLDTSSQAPSPIVNLRTSPPSQTEPSPSETPSPTPTLSITSVATESSKPQSGFVEGEVIVKYREKEINLETGAGQLEAERFQEQHQLEKKDEVKDLNVQLLTSEKPTEQLIAQLKEHPNVERVSPNRILKAAAIPNDTNFSLQWALHNTGQTINGTTGIGDADIDAPEAWNLVSSQQTVLVAVVDTGVLSTHPDVAQNMWDGSTSCKDENNETISGGCPNHGWDFVNNDNDPTDDNGHGTHVSGIIAAVSNNGVGVSGMSIDNTIKIMAVKFLGADNSGTLMNEIKAINFARHNGAKVINASYGALEFVQEEKDVIDTFPGLFIAAAGNEGQNNDDVSSAFYLCSYDSAHIICVAATDQNDEFASFSNYGQTSVDVGAPGVNIYSAYLDNGYAFLQGTSMATPHVAGLAALVWSRSPNLSASQVKVVVLDSGDSKESLFGNTVTGRRINAFGAFGQAGQQAPIVVINEFFVAGTREWIELYNPGNQAVNLSGWVLDDSGASATTHTIGEHSTTTVISPGGFLVVEDNFGLNDDGDTVRLFDSENNVIDSHAYTDDPNESSIGRNPDGGQNLQTFGSPTPGISNGSRFDTIYVDDDWTDSGNDGGYFWGLNAFRTIGAGINVVGLGGTVNVAAGDYYETLSIENSLTLIGAGTDESTIFDNDCGSGVVNIYASNVAVQNFTLDDDGCGASTVFLDSEVTNVKIQNNQIINGYEGIEISSDADSIVISNNTIYDHEDFGIWMNGTANSTIQSNDIYNNDSGGIRLDDGNFSGTTFNQNSIHDNYGYGIFSPRSSVAFAPLTISENTILNNAYDGINFRYVPAGATLNVSSNTVEGNGGDGGGGIYVNRLTDSTLSIIENNIRSNSSEGIRVNTVSNSTFALSSNTIANNSSTGIYLSGGGSSVTNSTMAISNNTVSSNDGNGIYADVITSGTFNILNNTIGENEENGIYICAEGECTDSTLTLNGNSISRNDSHGLYLYNILASTLSMDDNDILENGETGIYMQYIGAPAPSDPSTVTLTKNSVSRNSSYGIYLGDVDDVSRVEIGSGNTISANSSSGIYLDSDVTGVVITGNTIENNSPESGSTGIVVRSATGNEAHQNVISGNGVGVENQDGDEQDFFDATENYWGHASGPRHDDLNPDGLGDQISDTVLFSPFYEDQQLSILSELEFSTNDIASFVEHGIFDLPDDEEGQELVEFVTLLQQVAFKPPEGGEDNVVLPDGVRIERTDDQEFDWDSLSLQTVIEENLSGFSSNDIVEEAIQWGLPGIELEFSQPITISIFVGTALNGQTLNVKRSTSGSSGWTNSGIVAPATCVVTAGACSFQATKASFFAATRTTPSPSTTSVSGISTASTPSTGSGVVSPPTCNDTKPGSAPTLLSATSGTNSVTLTWKEATDPVSYYLVAYGTSPGLLQFGNPNIGGKGTTTFTVSNLSSGTTYYFRVRTGNGCTPGDYSNELSVTPHGTLVETPVSGFAEGILGVVSTPAQALEEKSEEKREPDTREVLGEGEKPKEIKSSKGGDTMEFLLAYSDLGLFILRIVIAVVFLLHGWPKITSAKKMVTAMGKPEMATFFTGLGIVEVVSALGLVAGLYVQHAALALSVVMLGAIYMKMTQWKIGFTTQQTTGWEFDLVLLAGNIVIITHGAGSIAFI